MPSEVLIARARAIEAWLPRGLFLVHLGSTFRFDDDLRPIFTLPHSPHLEHALGDVHGGVLATLVDAAAWCAAAVHYESWITTVDLHVRLLEPAAPRTWWPPARWSASATASPSPTPRCAPPAAAWWRGRGDLLGDEPTIG